jgi:hypothetical protein
MTAGLFDSPPLPVSGSSSSEPGGDGYRALSGTAIAAAALAVLSPLAFFGWSLLVVPTVGLALAAVALRDIANRPEAVTGRRLAVGALAASVTSLAAGLFYQTSVYVGELPEGYARLNYAMLQPLAGDPPTAVPDSAREMNGRDVLLKGYMYPGQRQRGITEFLLCRDQGDCCFGGQPKITDRVLVQLDDTRGIDFTQGLVKIAGRFRIEPAGTADLGGGVLYHLDDAFTR